MSIEKQLPLVSGDRSIFVSLVCATFNHQRNRPFHPEGKIRRNPDPDYRTQIRGPIGYPVGALVYVFYRIPSFHHDFARSYKEAQRLIMPLYFLVLIPAIIGLFPGIYLNATTALIPVLNVYLATKETVSGTIKTGLLLEVCTSLLVLAALSLVFCSWWW
jgi:hypothetical protein